MAAVSNVPQLVDKNGGSYAAIAPKIESGKFNKWKKAKSTESLSQTYTRYKTLRNELDNDGVNLFKHEINVGFVNRLLEKWLTFSQGLRNANHTQTLDLENIYGSSQAKPKIQKDYKVEYKKIKAKRALLEVNPSKSQTPKTFQPKNKGLAIETFNLDEEEVSDDE
ncbi:hypothetical protein Tco_0659710 [Tanacetum coccineum]